jgi:hypothetical protein
MDAGHTTGDARETEKGKQGIAERNGRKGIEDRE